MKKLIPLEGLNTKLDPADLTKSLPQDRFTLLHQLAGCGIPKEEYTGERTVFGVGGDDGGEVLADLIVRRCRGKGNITHAVVISAPYIKADGSVCDIPPGQRRWKAD